MHALALSALIESQIDAMTKIVLAKSPQMPLEEVRKHARELLEQAAASGEIQQVIADRERRKAAEEEQLRQQIERRLRQWFDSLRQPV